MQPLRQLRDTITKLGFPRPTTIGELWTADHFALFRSLPHLTRLEIAEGGWHDEELELLAADPPIHLQSLKSLMGVSARTLRAISRLPSLTELDLSPAGMKEESFDLAVIGRLPRLEILHIKARRQLGATQVIAAVKQCTAVTDLTLDDIDQLADSHLCGLLPALTRLRRLELDSDGELDDLSCISAASNLAGTLEHICILSMVVPHHALFHLRSLRRLHSAEMRIAARIGDGETTLSDSDAVYLPMLQDLSLLIDGEGDVYLHGMLGRLPQLRFMNLNCESGIAVPQIVHFLAPAPSLATLHWNQADLTDAHLCSLLPSLPHLRELELPFHSLASLRFASSSGQLPHSLETLTIPGPDSSLPANELTHLRSLGALRRLDLNVGSITRSVCDHDIDHGQSIASCTDIDTGASLAALTHLELRLHTGNPQPDSFDLPNLGPMPQLLKISLDASMQMEWITRALAHSTQLVDLQIIHPSITDEHLIALMPHFPHLTSFDVSSESHFGGLSFASSASSPRLVATLTRLTIGATDRTPMKPSDLHHLRALANLTTLSLRFPRSHASLAADLDDLSINSPRFRRDCWPQMRYSDFHCY